MKEIMVKHYQCDHCDYHSQWKHETAYHEKNCLSEQEKEKKRIEEYRQRYKDCQERAIAAALQDKVLVWMIKEELPIRELEDRASKIYDDKVFWDPGVSSFYVETYFMMINAVKTSICNQSALSQK